MGVFSKENKSGASIVIWNREGFVLASQSWLLNQAYSPSAIEAIATHTSLQFGMELGFTHAILEGDSLTLRVYLRFAYFAESTLDKCKKVN